MFGSAVESIVLAAPTLRLTNGRRGFDVHDHRVLEVNKVIVGIGIDGCAVRRGRVAGSRIGRRDRLRLGRRRAPRRVSIGAETVPWIGVQEGPLG